MGVKRMRLALVFALALSCATLAGTAGAGNGNEGTPPGHENATTPPGNSENTPAAQKQPAPAPQAAPQAKGEDRGKSASAPGHAKPAKAASASKPSKGKSASAPGHTKKVEARSKATGRPASPGKSADAQDHVLICHATGSESNPFVIINISKRGWLNGHSGHDDDRMLRDPDVGPGDKPEKFGLSASMCGQVSGASLPAAVQTEEKKQAACPPVTTRSVTVTETVVRHHAGPNKVVEISPSESSVHFRNKHPDEVDRRTTTVTEVVSQGACAQANALAGEQVQLAQAAAQAAPAAAAQPAQAAAAQPAQASVSQPAGGVAGAEAVISRPQAPAAQSKPAGGVLGEIAAIGRRELPFTGLQLWIAALIGLGLVAAGFGTRRLTT